MKLPLSWLKEFIPNLPPVSKLVDQLMMHGLEVEQILDQRQQFEHVVVGEVIAVRPHPNADKLQLVDVRVVPAAKPLEIVCGGPNVAVGQKVAVAKIGAKLPNGLTIEPRAIRGVKSNGMICAEDELGLGKNHAGILVLDPKLKVGTPFAKALGFDDPVLDLAIPANRSDLMAVRGLAWEIGAILGKSAKLTRMKLKETTRPASKSVSVAITVPKLCPLYTARVICGLTVKPSPAWLQNRLRQAGMRPINAVVDATNYVMLEFGQPLHAFDATKVQSGKITVRAARVGEKLTPLDGQSRALDPSLLVIADPRGPLALAGVMGGQDSEVSDRTTDIILEAAIFDPVSIRQTSRKLGLVSEASKRFEKGLWPSLPQRASPAAAAMIVELCGGTVEQGSVKAGKSVTRPMVITLKPAYIIERLGTKVSMAKSKAVLTRLGFVVKGTAKTWKVSVPEWRPDVAISDDVVDEVGRLVGYQGLPSSMPPLHHPPGPLPKLLGWKDTLRQILVGTGFTEVITHSYYGEREKSVVKGEHVEVANPLDGSQQYLRRSLVPSISKVLEAAVDAGRDARVFEISRIFTPPGDKLEASQPWKLAIGLAVKPGAGYVAGHLLSQYQSELVNALGLDFSPVSAGVSSTKGRTMEWVELDVSEMLRSLHEKKVLVASKFPPVTRDISFWWPHDEGKILPTIESLKLPLLQRFSIKDKFTKDGKLSYALSFVYQSPDRTLTKAEVDKLEQKIKDVLMKQGATIR